VRLFAILGGALIGMVMGYFIGVSIACDWLNPTSNLSGIYGVVITAPIGVGKRCLRWLDHVKDI
jgi:hypothetical protein